MTIHMPRELYDAAIKNLDCFERAGFAAEDFGEGCLRVREVPTILEDTPAEDLLTELCERLLREDPTVRNCPHGRPVAIVITRRELERMFGRIV